MILGGRVYFADFILGIRHFAASTVWQVGPPNSSEKGWCDVGKPIELEGVLRNIGWAFVRLFLRIVWRHCFRKGCLSRFDKILSLGLLEGDNKMCTCMIYDVFSHNVIAKYGSLDRGNFAMFRAASSTTPLLTASLHLKTRPHSGPKEW